jgi:hypothetical protein
VNAHGQCPLKVPVPRDNRLGQRDILNIGAQRGGIGEQGAVKVQVWPRLSVQEREERKERKCVGVRGSK